MTVRETKPFSSSSRKVEASIFWLISPTSRRSALKRHGPTPQHAHHQQGPFVADPRKHTADVFAAGGILMVI